MKSLQKRITFLIRDVARFSEFAGGMRLRAYQEEALRAVLESLRTGRGLSFAWIFPRQSGKDESLALLVEYLLVLHHLAGGEIVFVNPTFKPQSETSMRRLERRLDTNPLTRGRWGKLGGYVYRFGKAHCTYLSADTGAHVVGASASLLLLVNEAQDVGMLKFDKELNPMAASTNATRIFSGTRWTSDTLLEREYQRALELEKVDGLRRAFLFTAEDVRACNPAYGRHVDEAVSRHGRQHPLVRTQYFCETIDAQMGMFPPGRQALMRGSHPARLEPEPGLSYAFLIDVAGQDEALSRGEQALGNPGRDCTHLKIVEIDLADLALTGRPTYKVVFRRAWLGARHVDVFGALRALAQTWQPLRIVIDASGVGEGLWSLLDNACGSERVIPVKFTARLKSDLGYGWLGIIETGRYREYHPFDETLRLQLEKCRSEIVPGPAHLMRWGVPDGTRDAASGSLVHDDDIISASLCHILDGLEWSAATPAHVIPAVDPLEGMSKCW